MVRLASPYRARRLMLGGVAVLLASVLGPAPTAAAAATTLRFAPEADARVEKSNPKRNYGTSSGLSADSSPLMESYLRFTVAGAIGPVQQARLRLWAANGSKDGPAVYLSAASWSERSVTWATKPARIGGPSDDKAVMAPKAWVEFDVTSFVAAGDGTYNFVLVATSSDGAGFHSREAQNRPELVVVTGEAPPPPDTTPPDTSIDSGPTGTVPETTASFGFSADENATFECSLDGAGYTACTSPTAYADLGDGGHTFAVRAVDPAGNVDSTPATRHWTVRRPDTTPPDTTITDGPSGTVSDPSASFTFSADENATFECSLDGGGYNPCTSPAGYADLADGGHHFSVRATDTAGNIDSTPATREWTVRRPDTTPPDTFIDSGPAGTVTDTSAVFHFSSNETGAIFQCSLDWASYAGCSSPVTYQGLADGEHWFHVRSFDPAGNWDDSPARRTWTVRRFVPASPRNALLAPASGAHFGIHHKLESTLTREQKQAALDNLESSLGRTMAIEHWYEPWGKVFPDWRENYDFSRGRIPMISWGKQYTSQINSGQWDAYIEARADGIRALGRPVFIRWFWEMDGNRNTTYAGSPEDYKAAWRHIRAIFDRRGATNVAWVWCPNASGFDSGKAQTFYPGDEYVDWVCADGYNYTNYAQSPAYDSFLEKFTVFNDWAVSRGKPAMAGEYGAMYMGPGERARWINEARQALKTRLTGMLAVVYFHSYAEYNWQLTSEPDAFEAFRQMGLDPYFNP